MQLLLQDLHIIVMWMPGVLIADIWYFSGFDVRRSTRQMAHARDARHILSPIPFGKESH